MEFRIADTFTDSLAKLTGDEQKSVKTTAFDLQLTPASPGMQFHKLDRARDKNFWSVRVNRDIRLIVHKADASLLLCYVDHHDAAYAWAERRRLETHPTTGAAQLVEIRETVKEIVVPEYVEAKAPTARKPALFAGRDDDELLSYGVPVDWLSLVKEVNEDSLFDLTGHLPTEAAEALLELATGGTPQVAQTNEQLEDPFAHPDAQRRFRLMSNIEELAQALDYPWEKWAVFLHPSQCEIVQRDYNGPARVAGSAGTGKTVVALHRAARLAEQNPSSRILVTTFNDMLADSLKVKLRQLVGKRPSVFERIEVHSIAKLGQRLYASRFGKTAIVDEYEMRSLVKSESAKREHSFSDFFVWSEWRDVVDSWQLETWESYRDVQRLGRKTRLRESQRKVIWDICEGVRANLANAGLLTHAGMFSRLTERLKVEGAGPYDFAIIDEAQDISVSELRFLAGLCGSRPNGLFFAGDQGQRIFQPPFSWKSLGVDVRGRSHILRINYRTSHQIRQLANGLLPPEVSDVDGNTEDRRGTISAFNGPEPLVQVFDSEETEHKAVADKLSELLSSGLRPSEIAVVVRSSAQFARAEKAIGTAGIRALRMEPMSVSSKKSNSSQEDESQECIVVMTMHLAKGLEYRAVIVMACDDEVLPLQERIASVADDSDLEEAYNTERHLLYVACTRARDHLMVCGVDPASEFLDDLEECST